jgi:membrane protein YdbS with pleckstrin-like domain
MDDAFAPPGQHWIGPSHGLLVLRRLLAMALILALTALAQLTFALAAQGTARRLGMAATIALAVVAAVWAWIVIGRNWRSWGYAERDDDLLIRHGVLFRRLVVVPYGRMQFVDVTSGPLARQFGLATVRLHTAAAATDATIPGLLASDSAVLRDRLATLGQAQSAGL